MEQQSSSETPENHLEQTPQTSSKKKYVIAAVVAILIIGGATLAFALTRGDEKPKTNNNGTTQDSQRAGQSDSFAMDHLQGCKERDVKFTSLPIPETQLGSIEPMGKMNDGHVTPTDHMYVAPKNMQAADNTTDVVMPADGTVVAISAMPAQYVGDRNQQTAPEDHRLVIAHNCRYVSIFIHVHKLSDALQTALGAKLEPNTHKQVAIELKAGDKLGKIGGNPVDWSLMDATKTLSGFITPSLYKGESWKVHVIDPATVLESPAKELFIARSLRVEAPFGGKIDYDKKGALIGNWFLEGTNGYAGADQSRYWDGHLSIVPDYIDPSATILSIGNWQGKARQFVVKAGVPKPSEITKSNNAVKYEVIDPAYTGANGQPSTGGYLSKGAKVVQQGTVRGTALLQVMDGEKLKVELFPGKEAAQVSGFTTAAKMYVR